MVGKNKKGEKERLAYLWRAGVHTHELQNAMEPRH